MVLVAALVVSARAYQVNRIAPATAGAIETEVIPTAQFSAPLTDKVSRRTHKKDILKMLRQFSVGASNYTSPLEGGSIDTEYLTAITVGGQNFKVVVDTGSSNTWLAKTGFNCFKLDGSPAPQSECAFGTPGFNESASKTFVSDPNMNINLKYGDMEFLTGVVGFDTVTVGGMTVTSQEIGLITNAAWNGDGVNTGLLGLAYSAITSVYNGTDPNQDVPNSIVPYQPFFFKAVSENVVSNPYFSVALSRGSFTQNDQDLGYLAFGGIAPVSTTTPTVTVPVQGYTVSTGSDEVFMFYTVDIDSYIFDGSTSLTGTEKQAILDTGSTLNSLPTDVAKAYNAKFVPPATLDQVSNLYLVDCNATVPMFEVEIGGSSFSIDSKDQILPAGTDASGNKICHSAIQDGGDPSDPRSQFVLGDAFLHNVVVTFNIQSNRITLTQRATY
jgi:hypothetical protein